MFWISILYYILFLAPLLAEALIYPGVVQRYLGINPYIFLLTTFVISCILRLKLKSSTYLQLGKAGFYKLGPATTLFSIILIIVEIFSGPNTVYSLIYIDPVNTSLFGLYVYITSLPFINSTFFKKEYKKVILTFSFATYHALLTYWSFPNFFYTIQYEDGIVEYITFLFFFVSSGITFYSIKHIKQLKANYIRLVLILLFFGFGVIWFFVAGEEISWGQRILSIDTPEHLKEVNTQQELNIHNNVLVFGYVYIGYLLADLYGIVSPYIYHYSRNILSKEILFIFSFMRSRRYLILLFLPSFIYVLLRLVNGKDTVDQFEELTELYLSLAVLIISYINFKYIQNLKQS